MRLVADVRDGRRDSSVGELLSSVSPVVVPLIIASLVIGILVAIGLLLVIVPGLFLMTIWAVAAPVIVVERAGAFDALARSRELVSGNGWNVFGLIVILFLLLVVVIAVLTTIGALAGSLLAALLALVGSILIAPVTALSASVLYFNLRQVKGEAEAGALAVV